MLENDHPGSVGKILQNLLEKVEAMSLELHLPEKLVVLRAGSEFRNGAGESETMDDTSYDFNSTRGEESLEKSVRKEELTAVKDLIEMHMRKQLDDQTTRIPPTMPGTLWRLSLPQARKPVPALEVPLRSAFLLSW